MMGSMEDLRFIAFSCTVVSIATFFNSLELTNFDLITTRKLSLNSFSILSGPTGCRYLFIELRSNGSSCSKKLQTTKILPVRIFFKLITCVFITETKGVLQVMDSHHQSSRLTSSERFCRRNSHQVWF
jgi:hypothetical protein